MTRQDYAHYELSVARFLDFNNVKPGCHSPAIQDSEPFFSWSPCHCCGGSKGGNRETYRFACLNDSAFTADICSDCVYYLAYGQLDDKTMLELCPD